MMAVTWVLPVSPGHRALQELEAAFWDVVSVLRGAWRRPDWRLAPVGAGGARCVAAGEGDGSVQANWWCPGLLQDLQTKFAVQ